MKKAQKLASGNWRAYAYCGTNSAGKKRYKSFTHKSKREAERLAREFENSHVELPTSNDSIEKCMEGFIEARKAVLSPSTLRGYSNMKKALVNDYWDFCSKKLTDIRRRDVQFIVSGMVDDDLSAKSIRNRIGFLSAVFNYYEMDLPKAKLPEKQKPNIVIPTIDEVKMLIRETEGTEMKIPIMLGAFGGMRRGEIVALKMEDIDGNVIHVCHAVVEDGDGNLITKAPKTYESDRYVDMPDFVMDEIRKQGYITKIDRPRKITNRFARLTKKLGLDGMTFHSLRHFCASYLHSIGIAEQYIMERCGWSNSGTMKQIYRHSMSDFQKTNSEKIMGEMEKLEL